MQKGPPENQNFELVPSQAKPYHHTLFLLSIYFIQRHRQGTVHVQFFNPHLLYKIQMYPS